MPLGWKSRSKSDVMLNSLFGRAQRSQPLPSESTGSSSSSSASASSDSSSSSSSGTEQDRQSDPVDHAGVEAPDELSYLRRRKQTEKARAARKTNAALRRKEKELHGCQAEPTHPASDYQVELDRDPPCCSLVLQELIGQLVFAYCHLGTAVLLGPCENHLQGRIFNIASISVS